MDSKRRFKLRGQTVPDAPKRDPLTGKISKGSRRTRNIDVPDGYELNLIPFYELREPGLTASEMVELMARELRNQGINENAEWAVNAVCDALRVNRSSVIHRMLLSEMGVDESDATPAEAVMDEDENGNLRIPAATAAEMASETEAEGIFQNMVRRAFSIVEMRRTIDGLQRAQPERGYIYRRVRERIALYETVNNIAQAQESGTPMNPFQIMQDVLRNGNQGSNIDIIRQSIEAHTRTLQIATPPRFPVDPPRRSAPRQVDPVIRNAARPRAAPRGGLPPAMLQQSERRLEQRMTQFVEECVDLKDQNIRLTNSGQREDASNILNLFHAYRADIGSFPEQGDWRARAQRIYDSCWNQMFENRMRYDGSRGVRRINRRKP